jgi:catechol 2,3-dioxygenase-like lactoylglutathione lyase family enzyme
MTDKPGQTALLHPVLTSVAASLFVQDIEASCDFFSGKLGFAVDFVYGDPPFYAQVRRDQALLTLRHVDEPVFRDIRERESLLSASITLATVEETRQLFSSYQSAGVPLSQELRTEPWGSTTFVLRDPDGNLILFAGPVE